MKLRGHDPIPESTLLGLPRRDTFDADRKAEL